MMLAAHMRHWFEGVFNPFFLSILLLLVSFIWLQFRGNTPLVRVGFLLSIVGFWICTTGWVPGAMTQMLEHQYQIVEKVNPDIQWVVVFGGGHNVFHPGVPANDELSSVSIERLVEGVRLYRLLPKAKLVLSGGAGSVGGTESEASYMAKVAMWFDIPKKDIVLEDESFNTADEAIAIKDIVHHDQFYLVTSAVHMPRSMAFCRKQGLNPIASPTSPTFYWENTHLVQVALPNHTNLTHTSHVWHEILGMLWGKVRGLL